MSPVAVLGCPEVLRSELLVCVPMEGYSEDAEETGSSVVMDVLEAGRVLEPGTLGSPT
jgi:hypothetical protein